MGSFLGKPTKSYLYLEIIIEMKYLFPLVALMFVFSGCKKEDTEEQAAKDEAIIQEYIQNNNLNATATGSGLYYVIDNQGNGASCNSSSDVRVAYQGYFVNGDIFDESMQSGITFNLQNVIKGWTEGIPYFREGGSGMLLIPSALGYGPNGSGSIPGNTVLIFNVELLEVL